MTKRILLLIMIIGTILALVGCSGNMSDSKSKEIIGEGNVTTKKYDLDRFESISIANHFDVSVKKGSQFKVEVSTNPNIFDYLNLYVDNNVLYAEYKEDVVITKTAVKLNLTLPSLKNLSIRNDGIVNLEDDFNNQNKSVIKLENDAKLMGKFTANSIELTLSNDAIVKLDGSAESIVASGSSDTKMQLSTFTVKTGVLKLKSDASCKLLVTDSVDVTALNESIVTIYGEGLINEVEIDEDAQVKKVN